ncbi:membrane-spanning 4-domains subfamily A member 8-like [Hydractinia symbiolongicarpus]|uniref:membrane-spanning 4-domains subfamily A member 8-like n=1 Tax=Hydractinia symbiolongicarpus TaxID=13093 RepID=UPI00254D1ED7|nr:membrane-spanning 4-domains subfamily A member 8-like [Hydractinia symbiolongicarpus]XP_057299751.1 membrane-spanning 4-domains subfamily A member 8-like [Hydractinia symbiolongicarpus]
MAQPVQTVAAPAPAPHAVVSTAPPQSTLKVAAIRGLGITQIVIGTISVGCGIGAAAGLHRNWANSSGYAIWGGIWIIITGILATSSASYPNNRCLLGTSMAFNIVSTLASFFDGVIYAIVLGYYSNCSAMYYVNYHTYYYSVPRYRTYYYTYTTYYSLQSYNYHTYYKYYGKFGCNVHKNAGKAIYAVLLTCMIIEFFVALTAAILCCLACCSCCGAPSRTRGFVFQTQPQQVITYTVQTNQTYPVTAGVMNPVPYNYQQQLQYQQPTPMQQTQHHQLDQNPQPQPGPSYEEKAQMAYPPPSYTQ